VYYIADEFKFVKLFLTNKEKSMILEEMWQGCNGDLDAYLLKLELLNLHECSLIWQLSEFYTEIYMGDTLSSIRNQEKYKSTTRELDDYLNLGLESLLS
jgi:hypothetical protein